MISASRPEKREFPKSLPVYSALCLALCLLSGSAVPASGQLVPGLYEISSQMVLPHLEENLRSTAEVTGICIAPQEVNGFFPILDHPSLVGCRLKHSGLESDDHRYQLNCSGTNQIFGQASLLVSAGQVRGSLSVRMGGKNMTFGQRITAIRLSDCE